MYDIMKKREWEVRYEGDWKDGEEVGGKVFKIWRLKIDYMNLPLLPPRRDLQLSPKEVAMNPILQRGLLPLQQAKEDKSKIGSKKDKVE